MAEGIPGALVGAIEGIRESLAVIGKALDEFVVAAHDGAGDEFARDGAEQAAGDGAEHLAKTETGEAEHG